MNGAALKAGMIEGGRDGARANLNWFWEQIGAVQDENLSGWMDTVSPTTKFLSAAMSYSPVYAAMDMTSRLMSPYGSGPFYSNALEPIVDQMKYDAICDDTGPELHICAANVRTGKIKVFTGGDISSASLMASACLPTVYQAVEIDGEAYWDGGYTGNPALFPLFVNDLPSGIMVININPLHRDDVPTDPQAIQNRINEISFNSSLFRELRAINFVKRLLTTGALTPGTMKNVLVHMVSDDALMNDLSVATKSVPNPIVLGRLKAAGRAAADTFLDRHFDDLGVRDTVDLEAMFAP